VRVSEANFNLSDEQEALLKNSQNTGAEIFFIGRVRDFINTQNTHIEALYLSHYEGMTEDVIHDICNEAKARWALQAIRVIHRVGALKAGEQIVLVGVSSAHRAEAFSGAEYIMDELKTRATFWKKEIRSDGEHWLDMKDSDKKRAARWK